MNPVSAGSVKIRHTKIAITIEGCYSCGNSTGSRAWHKGLEVPIKIGTKEFVITLSQCDDCYRKENPLFTNAQANPGSRSE